MSLTPLAPHSQQVQSGSTSPVGVPPTDPAVPALYYQIDVAGNLAGLFMWSVDLQSWVAQAMSGSNWSEGLACGWEGPHAAKHLAPVPTQVSRACSLSPRFSVAAVSASPIPFEIRDITSGTSLVVASGIFPANAVHADAATCSLVDSSGAAVESFMFTPTVSAPVALFTCVPVGGHAAMPTDGESFILSFTQAY